MSLKFKGDAGSSSDSKNTKAFGAVMGGKLKLKGDIDKPKKKKKQRDDDDDDEAPIEMPEYSADPVAGTGKVTSSGVVVMGSETDFSKELEVGDTLLVTVTDRFRNTQADESRVVNMVLGKCVPRYPLLSLACAPRLTRHAAWLDVRCLPPGARAYPAAAHVTSALVSRRSPTSRSLAERRGAVHVRSDELDELHVRQAEA
eukprot:2345226-Prymnesium_polylepis.1